MIEVPRLRLLGVGVGGQCQNFLGGTPGNPQLRRRGFVFDDGSGLGAYIENEPALTLPIINPITGSAYDTPPGFPFLMIGTGSNPHYWRFVAGKTGQNAVLQWTGSQWEVLAAGSTPQLVTACSAGLSASVALFGCVQTGLDGSGNPLFALRKLTALDKRVMVGSIDGSGNQSFKCLAPTDHLEHPLVKISDTLRFKKLQAFELDGATDEAGGLPILNPFGAGAVTDGIKCYFSPTTGRLYRAAAGYVNAKSVASFVMAANTATVVFDWQDITLNYNGLLCTFQFCTGPEIMTCDILVDGTVKEVFYSQNVATANGSESSTNLGGAVVLSGIAPGVHDVQIRLKCKTGATIIKGSGSLCTLNP